MHRRADGRDVNPVRTVVLALERAHRRRGLVAEADPEIAHGRRGRASRAARREEDGVPPPGLGIAGKLD